MDKIAVFLAATTLLFFVNSATANDLIFPKTQAEIIKALGQNDGQTLKAPDGTTYLSEQGNIYKVIGGKRFRLRGIQIVEALAVLPKAGALINFGFDSSKINQDSFALLDEFGNALKNGLPNSVIMIAGHTDSRGPEAYNQKLSEQRARSVAGYLVACHGINPDRLIIKGFGEKQPIAENDTEENRSVNRRVEFIRIE
jgi:outer membrane protein OmpA-like peptidoglycan-associated protein